MFTWVNIMSSLPFFLWNLISLIRAASKEVSFSRQSDLRAWSPMVAMKVFGITQIRKTSLSLVPSTASLSAVFWKTMGGIQSEEISSNESAFNDLSLFRLWYFTLSSHCTMGSVYVHL